MATATSGSTAVPAFAAQPCLKTDRQEAATRAISLDWVVVRPAMLTNEPARGSVRAITDLAGVQGGKIARADVARFVVEQLTTDTWLRRNTSYLVVKGPENPRLIRGFTTH